MSTTTALTTIAICQIIITIAGFFTAMGLIYFLISTRKMISNKVDEGMAKVEPVIKQATSIAEQARETADKVSVKVDSIMSKAESTADKVTDRVEAVSTKVEQSVNPQVATAAGLIGAAVRIYQVYQDLNQIRKKQAEKSSEQPATVECQDTDMSETGKIETHI